MGSDDIVFIGKFVFFTIAGIIGVVALISWADSAQRQSETDTTTCRSGVITDLTGQSATKTTVHYTYKLDDGQRWSSTHLYQDGQRVCIDQ